MDWNDVQYFLALSRLGSVRAAGADLGVSHSTVARRVEALERDLCVRLFDRTRDGYQLTAAGLQMIPSAHRVEREMSSLSLELAGRDERLAGPIRLTCCDHYVSELIIGHLSTLCDSFPDIEIEMVTGSRSFDLTKREADIAVRTLGADAEPKTHLMGRKLAQIHCANYIAVEYEGRLDPDIEGSCPRWISFGDRKTMEMMVASSSYPDLPYWGAFSSLELMVQATRAGLGMAILPCYVADCDPALRRLRQSDIRYVANLWVLCHPDLRTNARFRAARSCVAEALSSKADLFQGRLGLPYPPQP